MYIQYGTYTHPAGEANLISFTVRPRFSPRRFRQSNIVQAQVNGTLKRNSGETESAFSSRIQSLVNALNVDGGNFGLYQSNGSPTPHFMNSSDVLNITGNQVVYTSFPQNHNGEYSSGRDFAYTIEAEYVSSESIILDYSETVSHTGNTGPQVQWSEHKYHAPTFTVEKYQTTQSIVQKGYAVTYQTWMIPPPPAFAVPFYLPDRTRITRRSPRRYPRGFLEYRIDWEYHFITPVVAPLLPQAR